MRQTLGWAAAGAALAPLFLALLVAKVPSPLAAAAACSAALLPAALGRAQARPAALACAALAAALGALVLLPALGAWWSLLAAAALACCGLAAPPAEQGARSEGQSGMAETAAAAFATVGLWRCASFLLSHSLYAACLVAASTAAGLAAGRALRQRPATRALRQWLPGLGPMLAGAAGLLLLQWLRFSGLHNALAERLRSPILGWADALRSCTQIGAGAALVAALLGALEERTAQTGWFSRLLLLACPFAAACSLHPLMPPGAAAAGYWTLMAFGAWRSAPCWRAHRVLSRLVPGALLVAAAIAWPLRGMLEQITLERLQAAYPGGSLLLWSEARGTLLGVYRFSPGLTVTLRDGAADFAEGDNAKLEAHLPLLAHFSRRVLFAGALHAEAASAVRAHGASALFYDSHPACSAALRAMAGAIPLSVAATCGGTPPRGPFDTIVVEIKPPLSSPRNALEVTQDSARLWRQRLSPGGLLAWRLPGRPADAETLRAQAALLREFADVAVANLGASTLLLASDSIGYELAAIRARVRPAVAEDLPGLREILRTVPWRKVRSTYAEPQTNARPLAALPARLL